MEFQTFVTEAGTHSARYRTLIPYILYQYSCDNVTRTATVPLQLIVLKAARCMQILRNVAVCRSTRRHIPEDSNLQQHHCESLKSCSDIPIHDVLWDIVWHIIQPSFILGYFFTLHLWTLSWKTIRSFACPHEALWLPLCEFFVE